jgi:arylformamidase
MPIDYEKEYDNRARVPEHPDIFARWQRETEAYRAASPSATLGLSYGPSKRQSVDLFPGKNAGADAPLAMFIHGGWWRTLDPSMFSQMAKGLNAHGVTVAVVGYDLCPTVSIATIIEQMRSACLYLWRNHK